MDVSIEILCFIIQIILVGYSVKVWHWRCFLSPGFYFGCIWGIGTIGVLLFEEFDLIQIVYRENIKELYVFVGFTALCFLFFTWYYRNKIDKNHLVEIDIIANYQWFKILSIIVLIISLSTFVSAGASFDMGNSREHMHEAVEKQSVFTGYGQGIALPLSIIAGSILGKLFQKKIRMKLWNKIFLFVPLIANLFFSIYLGGRVNFVYGFIQYAIGFCLTLKINSSKIISRKIFIIVLSGGIGLSVFISLVAAQRQQHYTGHSQQYELIAQQGPIYEVLYGPMEYMTASFNGYQFRRYDAVDEYHLGYGIYTFNGFINWTLPFANRFGLENTSIADLFDVRYNPQETYDYKRTFYYTTHSAYIPLIKDFGPNGTYFALIFITWISMYFFVRIQKKKSIKWATTIFFFYIFLEYWMKSNYYGTLSNTIAVTFFSLLLFDIINFFVRYFKKLRYESIAA